MNARYFQTLNPNRYWDELKEANQHHVTAQQHYLTLVTFLREENVQFKDVKNFMLNEAKRAGLLQRINGEYPSNKVLAKENSAWYVSLLNLGRWLNYNYDGDWSKVITSEMRKAKKAKKQAEKAQKKTATVTRNDNGEVRTDVVETTTDMDAPVVDALTGEQIEAIVLNNWDIIASAAEEKGAIEEFNALMRKMGLVEHVVEVAASN